MYLECLAVPMAAQMKLQAERELGLPTDAVSMLLLTVSLCAVQQESAGCPSHHIHQLLPCDESGVVAVRPVRAWPTEVKSSSGCLQPGGKHTSARTHACAAGVSITIVMLGKSTP